MVNVSSIALRVYVYLSTGQSVMMLLSGVGVMLWVVVVAVVVNQWWWGRRPGGPRCGEIDLEMLDSERPLDPTTGKLLVISQPTTYSHDMHRSLVAARVVRCVFSQSCTAVARPPLTSHHPALLFQSNSNAI
jgi:hypothetical protein